MGVLLMKVPTTIAGWCFDCEMTVYRDVIGFDVGVPGLLVTSPSDEEHECGYLMRSSCWGLTHRRSGFALGFADNPEQAAAIAQAVSHLDWTVPGEEIAHNHAYIEATRVALIAHAGEAGALSHKSPPVDVNP